MKRRIFAGLLILNCSINLGLAATNYSYQPAQVQSVNNQYYQQPLQYAQNNPLRGNVVMVPAGASIPAMLTTPISSEYITAGQTVSLALNSDFYYDGKLIAPAGSTVYGTAIQASKAKRGGINGKLCIRFTQIYTPYGTQIPISAVIKTDDSSGVLVGGTKLDVTKEYAKDLTAGSAAGALSGLVFGALAGGDVGRGAALGTAVGAGGGLVKSVWDKGNNVEIPANATIELLLTQPITVTASNYYYEN
ncbi:MAG: hypothetical protein E7Z89_04170 [Cyanobacteria bacterium SIG28]|nr:hypothetical protein [Cyanobacteria bacterium SIG28]